MESISNDNSSRNKTKEEILAEYNKYLAHNFKYPKAQFCYFYFKGICMNNKCQFVHGIKELDFDSFLLFIQDKEIFNKEKQIQWQKPYFYRLIDIKDRTYDSLFQYQNVHKDKFPNIYTQQELIDDSLKRMVIRREIAKEILYEFILLIFDKFDHIESTQLTKYINDVGYPLSTKQVNQFNIYFTKTEKKKKKITYYIKYKSNTHMMKVFVDILISFINDNVNNINNIIPFSFNSINSIINKRLPLFEASTFHYISKNNITQTDFCNELIQNVINESNSGKCNVIKGKTKHDLMCQIQIDDILKEINDTIYNFHFKYNNTQFACFNYEDLVPLILSKSEGISIEIKTHDINVIKHKLMMTLLNDNTLFFWDNTNKTKCFNYNKFNSFDKESFYNSSYHHICTFPQENNITNNETTSPDINEDHFSCIKVINDNIKIAYIDDENSLKYFIQKISSFKTIVVDIEGRLRLRFPDINLIQICSQLNEIFILDITAFVHGSNNKTNEEQDKQRKQLPLLINILKSIFMNINIQKIFFDGRNDLIAIHSQFHICVCNYFDLSSIYSAVNSFNDQLQFKINTKNNNTSYEEFNSMINISKRFYCSKGINIVLNEYHPEHKINYLKDKYHELFEKEKKEYFTNRPIIEEFLLYSVMDVMYIYDTFINLKERLTNIIMKIYNITSISNNNIELIMLIISSGHIQNACNEYQKFIKD